MPDSGAILAAILTAIGNDTTLHTALPDGVFVDVAPNPASKFVIVSLVEGVDTPQFGGRAFEEVTYLIKAVDLNVSGSTVETAAARIDQLFENPAFAVSGYPPVVAERVEPVHYVEVRETNPDIRWQHRGGRYSFTAATG
jgi:hypothetical protein